MIDGTDVLQERWDQERELRPLSQTETAGPDHTARSARMTTIKTPEQIAADVMGDTDTTTMWSDHAGGWVTIASQIAAAIEADRAQRTNPVVVIREGIGYEGGDVDIVDLDFIGSWPDAHGDFDQEDIDRMLATLRRGGFTEAAEDLEEWWAER